MQKGLAKQISTAFCILFYFSASAQTKIYFQTSDGFKVNSLNIIVYNPFGIMLPVSLDSTGNAFVVHQNCNRILATGNGYLKYDSIFKPEIKLGSTVTLTIRPIEQIMDEVVISGNKSGSKLRESPVSITIVKPYLVENKITADISQVLNQVPGVTVTDDQVNIRNGTGWSYGAGSRVMVLVDDLPMLSADAAAAQFAFIPVENIGSIEVVKSAGSVLYGSAAMNGVVNIRSAEPTAKPSASVSTFTGFYGNPPRDSLVWSKRHRTVSGMNGYFSQKIKNTAVTVSWNMLADEGYRLKEPNYRGRFSFRLNHQSQKITGLNYGLNASAQRGFSGSFLLWQNFANGYKPLDSGYTYTNTSRASIDPFITYRKGKTTHKLLSRVYLLDNIVDNGKPNNNQNNGSSLVYTEYKVSTWLLNNKLVVSGGAVETESETHSPLFSGKQKSRNIAGYGQLELRLKRLFATAGARYEYFKLNQFQQSRPVYRAGLNYRPAKATFLRASWGQGYRFPSMAEAFTTTTVGSLTIFPNPNLRPESGSSSEIGIKQGYKIGNFRAYVDVAAYSMTMNNMMEFTFAQWGDIFGPLLGLGFKSINVGKCRISGYEIESAGQGKIGNVLVNLLGGYTFSNPVCLEPNKVISTDTAGRKLTFENTKADNNNYLKYRYKHLLRFDVQARWKKLEAGISCRYNSAMLNIDKAFVEQPFDLVVPDIERSRKQLLTATVFDVRLAWYLNKHWKLNFQVSNLFNTLYMARPCDLRPPRAYQLQVVWKM